MSNQPKALRLADELLANYGPTDLDERVVAELRRLHQSEREGWRYAAELELERNRLNEAHDWQYKMAGDRLRRIEKLEKVNQELLEALEFCAGTSYVTDANEVASDAIAKAEEQ